MEAFTYKQSRFGLCVYLYDNLVTEFLKKFKRKEKGYKIVDKKKVACVYAFVCEP